MATLIFGAVASKDIAGILEQLAPIARRILFCPVDSPRATPCEEMRCALPPDAPEHSIHDTLETALKEARKHEELIVITGSLFLIGQARAIFTEGDYQASSQ
jgi:folylpolyglutamate synthase/dihydropteroate synthase